MTSLAERANVSTASTPHPARSHMPIPDFQSIMRPLLEVHQDGKEHLNRDLVLSLAERFRLTEDERREMLPSGRARLFDNRVGWAKSHITQAGLLESPRRAVSRLTERGRAVLRDHPTRVDLRVLNPLGLDILYLQAKRWEAVVGRPEIQKFAGALQGQRARKGIFITTSSFSADARDFVSRIDTKIILIDGAQLSKLMFDHGIGVSTASTYELKRLDSDYFADV